MFLLMMAAWVLGPVGVALIFMGIPTATDRTVTLLDEWRIVGGFGLLIVAAFCTVAYVLVDRLDDWLELRQDALSAVENPPHNSGQTP